jgi:hypothetical protein
MPLRLRSEGPPPDEARSDDASLTCVATIRQYLRARLVGELHLAVAPVLRRAL